MPKNKKKLPASVPSSEYHKYVPAHTSIHIDKDHWNGMGIDVFNYPRINEGVSAPAVQDYTMAYVLQGPSIKAYYSYNHEKWRPMQGGPNIFQLMNKDTPVKWQWRIDKAVPLPVTVGITLDAGKLKNIAVETFDKHIRNIEIPNSPCVQDGLMAELAKALKSEAESDTPLGKLYGETAGQLLAIHLLHKYSTVQYRLAGVDKGLSRRDLERVIEYIDAYMDQDISLETMARLCGISAYHFARMFRISTGVPPHQYVIERRVEKAKQLLAHATLPVLDIALQIGYESPSHFTSIFRKWTGCTPREYRKQHQK